MMPYWNTPMNRRTFVGRTAALSAAVMLAPGQVLGRARTPIRHPIPATGEQLPVIGMGTSRTFDVGDDAPLRAELTEVTRIFFDAGGTLIDSSPMYGRSESVVGDLLAATGNKDRVFAASKVWTYGRDSGIAQMQQSLRRMRVDVMDLMQIHNLRDWEVHLPVLKEWKQQGRLRYIGITTSHGRDHGALEDILQSEDFDFVQFSYNIEDRAVEDRLLPLAADRGIATLINRPFQRGALFSRVEGAPLPDWAAEFDCRSWGQYFLKFIVSHPAVTCAIPATSRVKHMEDNMGAGFGRLPDAAMRRRMRDTFAAL